MCLWAYLTYEPVDGKSQNITALIPLILGGILLLCHKGIKNNNKIIAHIAVLVTLLAIIGNASKPLIAALEDGRNLSIFRVSLMILTSIIAMIAFVKSFIKARQKK
jgi:hypothetical protein